MGLTALVAVAPLPVGFDVVWRADELKRSGLAQDQRECGISSLGEKDYE